MLEGRDRVNGIKALGREVIGKRVGIADNIHIGTLQDVDALVLFALKSLAADNARPCPAADFKNAIVTRVLQSFEELLFGLICVHFMLQIITCHLRAGNLKFCSVVEVEDQQQVLRFELFAREGYEEAAG